MRSGIWANNKGQKTKFMKITKKSVNNREHLTINNRTFEQVDNYRDLDTMISFTNDNSKEIKIESVLYKRFEAGSEWKSGSSSNC